MERARWVHALQDALRADGTVERTVRAVAGASGGPLIISGTLQACTCMHHPARGHAVHMAHAQFVSGSEVD